MFIRDDSADDDKDLNRLLTEVTRDDKSPIFIDLKSDRVGKYPLVKRDLNSKT